MGPTAPGDLHVSWSDMVEGLGVRTAPDERQDDGQGSVIVGDDDFKRPAPSSSSLSLSSSVEH